MNPKPTKVAVPLKPFQEALKLLGRSIPSKPSLPILSSVLIQIKGKELILSSTDLYFAVRIKISLSESFEAEAAIPAASLRDMISSFDSEVIYLQFLPENLLIEADGSQVKFAVNNPVDFPEFPEVEDELSSLSLESVSQISQKVCFAAGVDQARPVLTGLLLNFSSHQIEAVATDGFRLSVLKVVDTQIEGEKSLLIPARFFSEVSRIALTQQVKKIRVFINQEQRQLRFILDNTEIFVRLLEGEYPPYKKIIPDRQGVDTTYIILVDPLLKELKRAQVLAREESNIVEIKGDFSEEDSQEKLHKKDQEQKSSENSNIKTMSSEQIIINTQTTSKGIYQGSIQLLRGSQGSQKVALNIGYLQEYLQNIEAEQVKLEITDSLKPLMVTNPDDQSLLYVVMPFRVNS